MEKRLDKINEDISIYQYTEGFLYGTDAVLLAAYVKLKKDTVAIFALSNKYTLKTYKVWKLAPLFGQYPIKLDKDDVTN